MGSNSAADVAAFREAAVTGRIGVDPDAAGAVLKKIRAGKDSVERLVQNAAPLAQPLKVGANPVGAAISSKVARRAQLGSGDSYVDALQALLAQYEQVEKAIVTAMRNYHEIDQSSADPFRKV